jgi:hypothetical protein
VVFHTSKNFRSEGEAAQQEEFRDSGPQVTQERCHPVFTLCEDESQLL